VAQFLKDEEMKLQAENRQREPSFHLTHAPAGGNSLDRITEEKYSQSVLTIYPPAANITALPSKKDMEAAPEINWIDMDELESDEMYLSNAFNYHDNKTKFWQAAIIDPMRLRQKDCKSFDTTK